MTNSAQRIFAGQQEPKVVAESSVSWSRIEKVAAKALGALLIVGALPIGAVVGVFGGIPAGVCVGVAMIALGIFLLQV